MIRLDFRLDPGFNAQTNASDLISADEVALRFKIAVGDIIFEANGCDFSAKWGWVPIIDFAVSLRNIIGNLVAHEDSESVFEFTESNATISFERCEDSVLILASYASCQATVEFDELVLAIDDFSQRVFHSVTEHYPLLLENPAFRNLIPVVPD
jgi:hypothetical protein